MANTKKFLDQNGVKYLQSKNNAVLKAIVDAIDETKVDTASIVQTTGFDETAIMSQKSITDLFNSFSLCIASDGLIHVCINNSPIGAGISQVIGDNGNLYGYVDETNTIVLKGALANGAYSLKYEMEDGTTLNVGNMDVINNNYFGITKHLTNCVINNNNAVSVIEGGSYYAIVETLGDEYVLKSVTVTMGGSTMTFNDGNIRIDNVSDEIIITAIAEKVVDPTNLFVIGGDGFIYNGRCSSTGADRTGNTGYIVTNYIDVKKGDTVYVKNLKILTGVASGYSGMKLTDGTTVGIYPESSESSSYVTNYNYSESTKVTSFTINHEQADYVRLTLCVYDDGRTATEAAVRNANVMITVNEPLS